MPESKPFLGMREKNPVCGHKGGGGDWAPPREKVGYLGQSEAQLEMYSLLPPADVLLQADAGWFSPV